MPPVKLYVGEDYREPKLYTYTELLFPFWGVAAKESMPYVRAAALQYQYSKADFTLVDRIDDADYVLMPYQYDRLKAVNPERVETIISEARAAQKPLIIDGAGDIEHPIPVANSVIFRISQYRYSIKPNEITIPYYAEDLLESYAGGELELRKKRERPSVAFTGWAALSPLTRLKTEIKELPNTVVSCLDGKRGAERKGLFFREKALRALQSHQHIETHFITRASYSGHVQTLQGTVEDNRRKFVDNLFQSDYALCVKGDANASVRFYEALSLGRIPLFLDTACVLPLEDKINYKDFCVFVDWQDTQRIGDILAEFHEQVSPAKFLDMQKTARQTYEQYLRIDHFSAKLAERLRSFREQAPVVAYLQ